MPFHPTDELPVLLTITEWNQIIGELQNSPYRIAAPLINKINQQAANHEKSSYQNGEVTPLTPPRRPVPVDVVSGNSLDLPPRTDGAA
jgi:hypothetical protein